MKPVWERGIRVHGFWLDNKRVGFVSLPHGRVGSQGYGWSIGNLSGREETLKKAKRRVEAAFKEGHSDS